MRKGDVGQGSKSMSSWGKFMSGHMCASLALAGCWAWLADVTNMPFPGYWCRQKQPGGQIRYQRL